MENFKKKIVVCDDNSRPIISYDSLSQKDLSFFLERKIEVIDFFDLQSREYSELGKREIPRFVWVYYPWLRKVFHILDEEFFNFTRLHRNNFLVNEEEQKLFYQAKVGILGLSVGNSIATTLVLHGGGKLIKLADEDRLSTTNLNRIRTSFMNLGKEKINVTSNELFEMNPFIDVQLFNEKITEKNIDNFFLNPNIDICVDEIDDLGAKILLREKAREVGVPVVMATDLEDSVIIDVERYDLDRKYPMFHGRLDDEISVIKKGIRSKEEFVRIGRKLIGGELFSKRMNESLELIGKEIKSVPQLATAAIAAGALTTKVIRDIFLKKENSSYRKFFIAN